MPGPFPGMDPYLEDPSLWPDVHSSLIIYMRAALGTLLPSQYAAAVEERVYILPDSEREVIPDVMIRQRVPQPATIRQSSISVAADYDPPLILSAEPPPEIHETFLEIRNVRDNRRVVTTIEVLSPTNKAPHSRGRRLYRRKQQELLASRSHLIEMDLLRGGEHTVAAPRETLLRESRWDYLISLHRAGQDTEFEVWPVSLPSRLPRIAVPLDADVSDIVLDMQEVLNRCYDEGTYDRMLDYTPEVDPPLQADAAHWAASLLREKGLR